ncbi:MAG: hypothetical protein H0Z35_12370 [Thermoanaerobacteraceae bacterium]|nr:hypothetical protein [Thermoanaerobacteraceae bacterium]
MARRNVVEIIISAMDRATPALDKIAKKIERQEKKYQNLEKAFNKIGTAMTVAGGAAVTGLSLVANKGFNIFEERLRAHQNMIAMYGETVTQRFEAWAKQLEKQTATSRDAFLEEAQAVYTLTQNYGFNEQMVKTLIERSLDLAKAKGLSLREASERVIAAMRGEAESAEYLGLALNETTVKNSDYVKSLGKEWKELSEVEKAQARYMVFLEQSAYAEGIADREAKKRTATLEKARIAADNAAASFYEAVAPAIYVVSSAVATLLNWYNNLDDSTKRVIGITVALTAAITAGAGATLLIVGNLIKYIALLKEYEVFTKLSTAATRVFNIVLKSNPIGLVITLIGTLVGALIYLYKTNDTARYYMLQAWAAIKIGVLTAVEKVLGALEELVGFVPGLASKIREYRESISSIIDEEKVIKEARAIEHNYMPVAERMRLEKERNTATINENTEALGINLDKLYKNAKAVDTSANSVSIHTEKLTGLNKKLAELDIKLAAVTIRAGEDSESTELLTQKKEILKQKLALVNDEIKELEAKILQNASAKELDVEATKALIDKLKDLKQQQKGLREEINNTIESMTQQARLQKWMAENEQAIKEARLASRDRDFDSSYYRYVSRQVKSGGVISDEGFEQYKQELEREAREVARRQDVTMDVAREMAKVNLDRNKDVYHEGGIVSRYGRIPLKPDEVPIIAKEGEVVGWPGQFASGVGGFIINLYFNKPVYGLTDFRREVEKVIKESAGPIIVKQLRSAGVKV